MLKLTSCGSAVYIGLSKDKPSLGDSKFWGTPDLPDEFDWPVDADGYDMDFLCQINLSQADCDSGVLPGSGMLYFFGCLTQPLGFDDFPAIPCGYQLPEYFAVRYADVSADSLLPGEIVDENGEPVGFKDVKIQFSSDENICTSALHQLAGDAPDCDFDDDADGYSLLLCVDSFSGEDFTLEFENSGYLMFLIKNKDLENGNFDNVLCCVS